MILSVLFFVFFKIGLFTFGGGYAMLPFIQEEVIRHGWVSESRIIDFIAVSESTPGPFAVNMATYIGTETGGFFGAVCATLGVVLPSFIVILIVARFYDKYRNNRYVQGCMTGLKPAVIGLIGSAILTVVRTIFVPATAAAAAAFPDAKFFCSLIIFVVAMIIIIKKIQPILVIAISAGLGILVGYIFAL